MKYTRVEALNNQWKYVASNIICRADRLNAMVYIYTVDGKEVGVLAQNQRDAIEALESGSKVMEQQTEF